MPIKKAASQIETYSIRNILHVSRIRYADLYQVPVIECICPHCPEKNLDIIHSDSGILKMYLNFGEHFDLYLVNLELCMYAFFLNGYCIGQPTKYFK